MAKTIILLLCGMLTVAGCTKNDTNSDLVASGTTGSLTWALDIDGTLTISGKGEMPDYGEWLEDLQQRTTSPWYEHQEAITNVIIGNDVTRIGNMAFYLCENLTSVTIGGSVTAIGNHAFEYCYNLTEIFNYQKTPQILMFDKRIQVHRGTSSITGVFGKVNKANCILWVPAGSIEAYRDADVWLGFHKMGVIGDPGSISTFIAGNEGTFRWRLSNDGTFTFSGTGDMPDFNEIRDIYPAWHNIKNSIINVVIEEGVTRIGSQAFMGCSNLTAILIDSSVTRSIGASAFLGCSSLVEINVNTNNNSYISIDGVLYCVDGKTLIQYPFGKIDTHFDIPESVTTIGENAFANCINLTSIAISNSVTSIGGYAFRNSQSLISVFIDNSVTAIGQGAFSYCLSLISVIIPESVVIIGDSAFTRCISLKEIINYRAMPLAIGTNYMNVFNDVNITECVLYVPATSVEAYSTTDGWKDFVNIKTIQ